MNINQLFEKYNRLNRESLINHSDFMKSNLLKYDKLDFSPYSVESNIIKSFLYSNLHENTPLTFENKETYINDFCNRLNILQIDLRDTIGQERNRMTSVLELKKLRFYNMIIKDLKGLTK